MANTNDGVAKAFLDSRATGVGVFRFGPLVWGILDTSHPFAERRVADDRNQLLDASPQFLPVLDKPETLLIAQIDPWILRIPCKSCE
jgi:hypothetical protein